MFWALVRVQWKRTRAVVLLSVLAAFAIPVVSVGTAHTTSPRDLLTNMQQWGMGYAGLAGAVGLLLAMQAWVSDHRGHHVYALVLPVARWRYVLMRFGAGVVFLVPVVIALALGAFIATSIAAIPVGLRAYPFALALRFGFSALVAFSIFFAISASTARSAAYILGALGAVLVAQFLGDAIGLNWNVLSSSANVLLVYPGILSVFAGRWMLIDV